MGNIVLATTDNDITGTLSQEDLNSQNLQTVADELNRLEDNQDSINNTLTIIGQDTLTVTGASGNISASFSTDAAYTFMAYFTLSTNLSQFYPVPTVQFDESGTPTLSVFAYSASSELGSDEASITFNYFNTTAVGWTFYYFLISQPASVITS